MWSMQVQHKLKEELIQVCPMNQKRKTVVMVQSYQTDMLSTLIQMELVSQLYAASSVTLTDIKLQVTQRYSNEIMNHVMFTEKLKRLLN